MDERIVKLAKGLVQYSVKVKENDKVYIHYVGKDTEDLARQLVKVYAVKGFSLYIIRSRGWTERFLCMPPKEQLAADGRD